MYVGTTQIDTPRGAQYHGDGIERTTSMARSAFSRYNQWIRWVALPFCLVFGLLSMSAGSARAQTAPSGKAGGPVVVAKLDGPILPPTKDYYERALRRAEGEDATCLLVEMDTPGGLLSSMREITQLNLSARVPVVVFITPPGARAGSAGAVIALSANLIAMSPGTNIGAAHPVAGGGNIEGDMRDKVTNDAAD